MLHEDPENLQKGKILFFAWQFDVFCSEFGKKDRVPQPPFFVGEPGRLS
jgi:hypothetical protein